MADDNEPYIDPRNLRRKLGRRVSGVTEKYRLIARSVLRKGVPISKALERAGYASAQARKGMAIVKRAHGLREAFQEETRAIEAELAAGSLVPNSWNAREQLILTRLEKNVKAGKDGGTLSCKVLGSHKALSLFEPEFRSGVIVVQAPAGLEKREEKIPEIDE